MVMDFETSQTSVVTACISGFGLTLMTTLPRSAAQLYWSVTLTLTVDEMVLSTKLLISISIKVSFVVIGFTKFELVKVN